MRHACLQELGIFRAISIRPPLCRDTTGVTTWPGSLSPHRPSVRSFVQADDTAKKALNGVLVVRICTCSWWSLADGDGSTMRRGESAIASLSS